MQNESTEKLKRCMKEAGLGYDFAQNELGMRYYYGDGVRQNYDKAFEWYQKSAEQGDSDAQLKLGFIFYEGEGVRQNELVAKEWFGKSCDNGNQAGCDNYRILNEEGY